MRRPLVVLLVALVAGACRTEGRSATLAQVDRAVHPGLAAFAYDDLGALSRDGFERTTTPWKLAVAALLWRKERERGHPMTIDSLPALLRSYGFLDPARIANWSGPRPARTPPAVGFVVGDVPLGFMGMKAEAFTLGCAACHSGTGFDAAGRPTGEAWLGLPSSSIALDAFSDDVFSSLREGIAAPKLLMRRVVDAFPDADAGELLVLERVVLPRAKRQLDRLAAKQGGALPFRSGPPGITNGLAALKYFLRTDHDAIDWSAEHGSTAIPDLSSRHLRSTMFIDGVYVPRGGARGLARSGPARADDPYLDSLAPILAIVAVPAMGIPAERAVRAIPTMREMLSWLSTYRPPAFPGPIDTVLANEGAVLFQRHCATCHGSYASSGPLPRMIERYPNRLVPIERIGTDPLRLLLADSLSGEAIRRSPFDRHLEAESGTAYVPPILNGIWATAPYLHNGSVPTVWDLLSPDTRPERFMVGGHMLDYAKLGVALVPGADGVFEYPVGYQAVSRSELYDTRMKGRGNGGHRSPGESLTEGERRRIIEYLKTL